MEVRWYTAKDYINTGDPVFLYHSNKKNKDYAYSSYANTSIDGGQPVCIGVAINSASKDKTVKVSISGVVEVNYIGDIRTVMTDVFVITKYKSKSYNHGYVSYLCNDITPFIFEKHHIIKLGTIFPSNNDGRQNPSVANSDFVERKVKIQLSIENKNYDYHNIGNFGLVPNNIIQIENGVNNFTFSYQDIASDLKEGLEHPDVVSKFNDVIYDVSHSRSKNFLYKSLNAYCETLFTHIPNALQEVAPEFIKRLIVTSSSGQLLYDSENNLRIWDTVADDFTKIPLIANHFGETEFNLAESIINAHLYPYIDTTLSINSWVLKSGYTCPVNTTYQMIKSTINGIGYGERYDPVTNYYNFAVSAFVGTTANFNKHNSEGLIVQLNWMQDPVISIVIWEVNTLYNTIIQNYNTTEEQFKIAAEAKAEAEVQNLLAKQKRDLAITAATNGDFALARSLAMEIFIISGVTIKNLAITARNAQIIANNALISAVNANATLQTYLSNPFVIYLQPMINDGQTIRIKTEQKYVGTNAAAMQSETVLGTSYQYAIEAWLVSNVNNAVPTTGWIYPLGSGPDTLRIKSPDNRLLLDGGNNIIGTFAGLYVGDDVTTYGGLYITNPLKPSMSNGSRTFPLTIINDSVPKNYGFLSRIRFTYTIPDAPVGPGFHPPAPYVPIANWSISTTWDSGLQRFSTDLIANNSSAYINLSELSTDMIKLGSLALPLEEYEIIALFILLEHFHVGKMDIKYVIYDETKTSGNYIELETEGYNGITGFSLKPETPITTPWLKNNPNNINLVNGEITYDGTPVV
jgi:hypothetical protein